MKGDGPGVLVVLGVLLGFWVLVIVAGLALRKKIQRDLRASRARDLCAALGIDAPHAGSLLVGLLQDFSWSTPGLLVRDGADREVGRVTYRFPGRIELEVEGVSYRVEVQKAPFLASRLVRADGAAPLSTSTRSLWKTGASRYHIPGYGELVVRPTFWSPLRADYPLEKDGEAAGRLRGLKGLLARGGVLLLTDRVPLPVRVYLLALEYRRLAGR